MGDAEWADDWGHSVSIHLVELDMLVLWLTVDRFDKLGHTAAFAFPVAMLVIDIVLRLLIIEKKGSHRVYRPAR